MKTISFCFAFVALSLISPTAFADADCGRDDVSRKVERQAAKWERRAKKNTFGNADQILAEIEEKLASDSLTACELERISTVQINVGTLSSDLEKSIPALEHKIANTTPETNPDWTAQVDRLSRNYRSTAQFEKLRKLSVDHLPPMAARTTNTLEQSLVLALIGLDQPVRAYSLIVEKVNVATSRLTLWDLQMGFALAMRLGREEDASALREVANASFGGFRMPGHLPLIEGDDVDHLLARETDPRYKVSVTKPPIPNYPGRAAERGMQGACDVEMDIDTEGKPMNVIAYCSDGLFVAESQKAARKMRFEPLEIDGETYEYPSFSYPLEYTLQ